MVRRWLALLAAALLLLVACTDDTSGDDDADGVAATTSSTAAPPETTTETTADDEYDFDPGSGDRSSTHRVVESPEPEVTVLDAGAEPRRELRLVFVPGSEQSLTMQMMMAQQLFVDGAPVNPEVELTYTFDIASRVVEVDDGSATVEMTYTDFDLVDQGPMGPAEVAQFERTMDGFMGLSFFVTTNDRGATLRVEIPRDFPATGVGGVDDMLQEFDTPSVPLPVEAVGVGARWQVEHAPAPLSDLPMPTVTEVELLELHDDHVVMRNTAVTAIEPSTIDTPQGSVEFLDGEITNRGTLTWFFDSVNPASDIAGEGVMSFVETMGSQQVEAELHQRMQVTSTVHD
ncbi:MAG: hypothetical protein U5K29_13305 [Acidimicrobiales bacterium]|nr:hypothetical protein [Acidimicrobiales bacterium]